MKVELGGKVKEGSVVLMLESAEAVAAPPAAASAAAPSAAPAPVAALAPVAAPVVSAPAAAGPVNVHVPDIGDFKDVTVIELLVKVGDSVKVEQSLITVESDKASMEIPSSAAGVVQELKVKLGDKVNIGDLVAVLQGTASAPAGVAPVAAPAAPVAAAAAPAAVAASAVAVAVATPAHQPGAAPIGLPHASPSVRKFARELGVPLNEVKGTGLKGRITTADVQASHGR